MGIQFHGSPGPTLGIEIEVQLIDPETRELAQSAPLLLEKLNDDRHYKPEFIQSNLEINSDICEDVHEAYENIKGLIDKLIRVAEKEGYRVCCAGTHPFSSWKEQIITQKERYLALANRHKWASWRLVIFGIHFHVGVKSGEHAISILNSLMFYIPHLLALSSSSPFWMGIDTGLYSARAKVFEGLATAGLPYMLVNWNEFVWFMNTLVKAKAIESIREIWWDIRPHNRYGTLEVRVCDGITRATDIVALAALTQALVVYHSHLYEKGERLKYLPRWLVQENKWRAARFGLDAEIILDRSGDLMVLRDSVQRTLDTLEPVARDLGSIQYWERLHEMSRTQLASDRMRVWYQKAGNLKSVVDNLILEFKEDRIVQG